MKLSFERVAARLRTPFAAAWGTVSERELLVVRLEADDGTVGWGEAAPLPGYDDAGLEQVRAALDAHRAALAGAGDRPREELLAACAAAADLPDALAAVDLALWDLEGRRRGEPVCELLTRCLLDITPDFAKEYPTDLGVTVNATVAALDPAAVAEQVTAARAGDFRCIKIKAGLGDDAARVAAARSAAGEEVAIRIDANGAWSVERAVAALETLEGFGIELCEEPVHGLKELEAVAGATSIPIALDETAAAGGAFERRVCDAACLKIARSGGLTELLARALKARGAGYRVYFASTLDGPLGIAAALHAAIAIGPDLPCGLATLGVFADRPDPLPARRGRMTLPSGPGLGDQLAQWYR